MPRVNKKYYPPYISWSRLSLYERSPQEYERVYLLGEGRTSPQMELGSRIAKALETGESEDGDELFLNIIFPKEPLREFKIEAELDGIPLVGVLDAFNSKQLRVREYKTGKNWTQRMVDEHGQLTFYALLVYLKHKQLPKEIVLNWAETTIDEDGNVKLTGRTEEFTTERKMSDVFSMCTRIRKAYEGIALLTKQSRAKLII